MLATKVRYFAFLLVLVSACNGRVANEKKKADLIAKGDALVAKGDHGAAATAYQAAARLGQPDAQLLTKGATTNMRAGRFRAAMDPAIKAADPYNW